MEHTKGDWFVQGDKYPTIQSRHNGDGIKTYPTIATVNSTFIEYEEYCANAKLIAAAPELLEALQEVISIELLLLYPEKPFMSESMKDEAQAIDSMICKVKQVIKKATELYGTY